jgi:hypothetical protein
MAGRAGPQMILDDGALRSRQLIVDVGRDERVDGVATMHDPFAQSSVIRSSFADRRISDIRSSIAHHRISDHQIVDRTSSMSFLGLTDRDWHRTTTGD